MSTERTGTEAIGPLIGFEVRTGSGTKLPLRAVSRGHDAVRAQVAGKLNPDLPLLTYRAGGETIVLTLRDLKLAP